MLQAKPKIISPPRSPTSCGSLPPEGAARLWPGEAGSTAQLEGIGCEFSFASLPPFPILAASPLRQQGPRDWLCQTADAAVPAEPHSTRTCLTADQAPGLPDASIARTRQ